MQNYPLDYDKTTVASSRFVSAVAHIAWERALADVSWLRLDYSDLDTEAMLTLSSYLEGIEPEEVISELDSFYYTDETNNVVDIGGTEDLYGDIGQSLSCESDIILDNSDDRFVQDDITNQIQNPSFELGDNFWNWSGAASGFSLVGSGSGIVSGTSAVRIIGDYSTNYLYTDLIDVESGISPTMTGSVFAQGTGNITLEVITIASGLQTLSSSTLNSALSSGEFGRYSIAHQLPSNASGVYLKFGTSSGAMIADCAQLEIGTLTDYSEDTQQYVLPKRPIRLQIKMARPDISSGNTLNAFTGLTKTMEPDLRRNTLRLYCQDFSDQMKTKYPIDISSGMSMYQNYSTDTLIRELGYRAGIGSGQMNLELGRSSIDYAWFQEGSVWYYMQQIAEAEGGRVFFDRDGILNFWNREHMDINSGSSVILTLNHDITDLTYNVDDTLVFNSIKVVANPRSVQPLQSVWSLDTPVSLPGKETTTVWAQITDQDGAGMPCTGIVTPSAAGATSRYTAIDQDNNDVSSQISVSSISKFATSVKINFYNNSKETLTLSQLILYGTPAKIKEEISIVREDPDSIAKYGKQELIVENDLIQTVAQANTIALKKLELYKNPLNQQSVEIIGRPYIELGDVVTVQDNYNNRYNDYYVIRNQWALRNDDDFIQNLKLIKREKILLFVLDVSQLDSNNVLGV